MKKSRVSPCCSSLEKSPHTHTHAHTHTRTHAHTRARARTHAHTQLTHPQKGKSARGAKRAGDGTRVAAGAGAEAGWGESCKALGQELHGQQVPHNVDTVVAQDNVTAVCKVLCSSHALNSRPKRKKLPLVLAGNVHKVELAV